VYPAAIRATSPHRHLGGRSWPSATRSNCAAGASAAGPVPPS